MTSPEIPLEVLINAEFMEPSHGAIRDLIYRVNALGGPPCAVAMKRAGASASTTADPPFYERGD